MFDQHPSDARAAATLLFENADWRVLGDGLEHRATGYFIGRDSIAARRGAFWEWPLHLAEKNWCSGASLRQAFLAALDAFGVGADADLTRSFTLGFGLVAGSGLRTAPAAGETDGFVALGHLVRPKPAQPAVARKRVASAEPRPAGRRTGTPLPQRTNEAPRQRAVL